MEESEKRFAPGRKMTLTLGQLVRAEINRLKGLFRSRSRMSGRMLSILYTHEQVHDTFLQHCQPNPPRNHHPWLYTIVSR